MQVHLIIIMIIILIYKFLKSKHLSFKILSIMIKLYLTLWYWPRCECINSIQELFCEIFSGSIDFIFI